MANSHTGGEIAGSGSVAGSHNLVENGSGGLGDTIIADPVLGSLQNNGGPIETRALLSYSPAIDAGSNALIPDGITTDQRGPGFPRVFNNTVDIGAFEIQTLPPHR